MNKIHKYQMLCAFAMGAFIHAPTAAHADDIVTTGVEIKRPREVLFSVSKKILIISRVVFFNMPVEILPIVGC